MKTSKKVKNSFLRENTPLEFFLGEQKRGRELKRRTSGNPI
jgi:hypothetical protein